MYMASLNRLSDRNNAYTEKVAEPIDIGLVPRQTHRTNSKDFNTLTKDIDEGLIEIGGSNILFSNEDYNQLATMMVLETNVALIESDNNKKYKDKLSLEEIEAKTKEQVEAEMARVAVSIWTRFMAQKAYEADSDKGINFDGRSNSSISKILTSPGQYQPTFKNPQKFSRIKDENSSVNYLKYHSSGYSTELAKERLNIAKSVLADANELSKAAGFLQGRTDFLSSTQSFETAEKRGRDPKLVDENSKAFNFFMFPQLANDEQKEHFRNVQLNLPAKFTTEHKFKEENQFAFGDLLQPNLALFFPGNIDEGNILNTEI
ncbi:MAG: hypothetical protein HRT47_11450 [Candidatus Caenarcaniphilales bacterium]|nr:hypothetical protein [Candidatus Caenarcaniphilales bacterium]